METKPRIIGTHLRFFREGTAFTVPEAGTASVSAKPGAEDTGWINFGRVMNWNLDTQVEEKQIWAPSPGSIELHDIIETKKVLGADWEVNDLSPLAIELMFKTGPLSSSSTQYNPNEGGTVKGWLKGQQYDHTNTLVNTFDKWIHLRINGPTQFGEDIVKPKMKAMTLYSILNTGALA